MCSRYFTMYTLLSLFLTVAVVQHAFTTREQFYPAVLYLFTSKLSLLVLLNQSVGALILFALLFQSIFLGKLEPREEERVHTDLRHTALKVCFALTMFREELNARVLSLFAVLLFSKYFHAAMDKRVEGIESEENVAREAGREDGATPAKYLTRTRHVRHVFLMALLLVMNTHCLTVFTAILMEKGPSVLLLFAAEYCQLCLELLRMAFKYGVIFAALRIKDQGELWLARDLYNTWGKLTLDVLLLLVTLVYFYLIAVHYGMPIIMMRDLHQAALEVYREFTALRTALSLRRNIHRLACPTEADILREFTTNTDGDRVGEDGPGAPSAPCIICHAEIGLSVGEREQAKRLPCSHIYHTTCILRWWLKQPDCKCTVCGKTLAEMLKEQEMEKARASRAEREAGARGGEEGGAAGDGGGGRYAPKAAVAFEQGAPPGLDPKDADKMFSPGTYNGGGGGGEGGGVGGGSEEDASGGGGELGEHLSDGEGGKTSQEFFPLLSTDVRALQRDGWLVEDKWVERACDVEGEVWEETSGGQGGLKEVGLKVPLKLEGENGFNTPLSLPLPRGTVSPPLLPSQDASLQGMLPLLQQLFPPMPNHPPSFSPSGTLLSSPFTSSPLPSHQRSQLQLAHAVLHSAAQSHAAAVAQHQAQAKLIAVVQELISNTLSGEGEGGGFASQSGGGSSIPLKEGEGVQDVPPLPANVDTAETRELVYRLSVLEALEKSTQETLTSNQTLLHAALSAPFVADEAK